MLLLVILTQSCKEEKLEDFSPKKEGLTSVSIKGMFGQVSRDAENIRIPIEVKLSTPATQTFDAHLELDESLVLAAISGNLLPNTSAIPHEHMLVPQTVVIPFGATSAVFEAVMSVPSLEKFYFSGKKVAFGLKLTGVAKGNQIDDKKSTAVISIDPLQAITESEMHALSMTNGAGGKLEVFGNSNYVSSAASISIPLGISLTGSPERSFTVDVAVNTDTISVLKTNGTIPQDAVVMLANEFEVFKKITVAQSSSSGILDVVIPSSTLLKYKTGKIALVVQLVGSSRHVLHPVKRTVVLLIDPASIILENKYAAWFPSQNKLQFSILDKTLNS